MKKVGVLAVQGAFVEHEQRLAQLGVSAVELRQASDISEGFDGLVLPGGESTVQSKLLRELNMFEPLRELIDSGLPVLGTCAGLILLAREIENDAVDGFASLPVRVQRNAYGRQLGSFHTPARLNSTDGSRDIPATFIRAPRISALLDNEVQPLVELEDGTIAGVRYKNLIGLSFHPELDEDLSIYEQFLSYE